MDDAVITFDLPEIADLPISVWSPPPSPDLRLAEVVFQRVFADPNVRPLRPVHIAFGLDGPANGILSAICERLKLPQVSAMLDPSDDVGAQILDQVDRASDIEPSRRLELASIGVGPLATRVLDAIDVGAYQPGVLHCTGTSSDGWAARQVAIEARGYAAVATFGSNVFFVHPTIFRGDERPRLATFDVFDTLIARRCVDPWRVFEEVGALHGLPDFAEKRQTAERRLLPGDYGLDDIYREVAAIYGIDAAAAAALQASEIACELNNVIPIAENMARVKHGDLLISDMYLGEEPIRRLLVEAGFDKNVGLSVATHGKSKGQVWPKLAEQFIVERHLGDNPHADFGMPQRFGLTCELTEGKRPESGRAGAAASRSNRPRPALP